MIILSDKAEFEHANPYAKIGEQIYHKTDMHKATDEIYYALMAIAYELNKIRTGNLNVEARTFDGDK